MPQHTKPPTNLALGNSCPEPDRTVSALLRASLQQQVLFEGNTQPRLVYINCSQWFVVFVVRYFVLSRFQPSQLDLARPTFPFLWGIEGVIHPPILLDGVALRRVVAVGI